MPGRFPRPLGALIARLDRTYSPGEIVMRYSFASGLLCFGIAWGVVAVPTWAAGPFQKPAQKPAPAKEENASPAANKAEQLFSMARLAERQGKLAEARTMYVALIEKYPQHRDAIHRLGAIAVRTGDIDVALEHLGRAEEIGPTTPELVSDIGYALYLQDRLPLAEQKFREALQLNPQYAQARNNLGIVLGEQRKFDQAFAEFRKANNEAKAYCNLAYVQTKVGALAEAEKNYHKALELDGSLKKAAEALVQFESAREKAKRIAANEKGPKNGPRKEVEVVSAEQSVASPIVMDEPADNEELESPAPLSPPVQIASRPAKQSRPLEQGSQASAKPSSSQMAEEASGESLASILRNAKKETAPSPKSRRAEPIEAPATDTEEAGTDEGYFAQNSARAASKPAQVPAVAKKPESGRMMIDKSQPTGKAVANPFVEAAQQQPIKPAAPAKTEKTRRGPVVLNAEG